MVPQVVDHDLGRFRQYFVEGVMTIGLTHPRHVARLMIDPGQQWRFFCYFVSGKRYPDAYEYLDALRQPVQTPTFYLPLVQTASLNCPIGFQTMGFIHVQIFKDQSSKDGPVPMMVDSPFNSSDSRPRSARNAPIATDVPENIEEVANFFIRVAKWSELRRVAKPLTEQQGFGRPLTEEDNEIKQFWSSEAPWS